MVDIQQSKLNHAGLLERGIAWFLDGLCTIVVVIFGAAPLLFLAAPSSPESAEALGALFGLTIAALYYIGTEAKWGATPGKMMLGLQVVMVDGRKCSTEGAIIRNITKILGGASLLSVVVAVVLILSSEDNQRLGDMLGETTVIRT